METIHDYQTTAIALEELKNKGYTKDFNVDFKELFDDSDNFVIDYLYRYEGITDPGDESSVYGLRDIKTGSKGVFVVGNLSLVEGKKRDIIINLEIKSKAVKPLG